MIAPYCSVLRERLKYNNPPQWVDIHAGLDAWERAKQPASGDTHVSVWDGKDYEWPVAGCYVRVEIHDGPSVADCRRFAVSLLEQGAYVVLLWFFDRMPIAYYQDEVVELELSDLREVFDAHG